MPKLNFTDIGDLQDYRYQVRTIKSINSAEDTCVLKVLAPSTGKPPTPGDGERTAKIFYHCSSGSVLRVQGDAGYEYGYNSIKGGAAGFAVGSSVVVLQKYDKSKTYVVAHTDGIRACGGVIVGFNGLNIALYNDKTGFYESNFPTGYSKFYIYKVICDTGIVTIILPFDPGEESLIYAYVRFDYTGKYLTGFVFSEADQLFAVGYFELVHARILKTVDTDTQKQYIVRSNKLDIDTGVPSSWNTSSPYVLTCSGTPLYNWTGQRARGIAVSSKGVAVLVADYTSPDAVNCWRPDSYHTEFYSNTLNLIGSTKNYPIVSDMRYFFAYFFYACDSTTNIVYCVMVDYDRNDVAPYDMWGTVTVDMTLRPTDVCPGAYQYSFELPRGGGQYAAYRALGITSHYLLVEHWQTDAPGGIMTGTPLTQAYDLDKGGALDYSFTGSGVDGNGAPLAKLSTTRMCVSQKKGSPIKY